MWRSDERVSETKDPMIISLQKNFNRLSSQRLWALNFPDDTNVSSCREREIRGRTWFI